MEGFVYNDNLSPFDYGLTHSTSYANYGVDKSYVKVQNKNQNRQNLLICSDRAEISPKTPDINTVDTVIDKSGKHRLRTAALIAGGATLGLGGAAFAIIGGHVPKAITNSAGKLVNNISQKTEALLKKPNLSKLELYSLLGMQAIKQGADMLRGAVFNLTPFKDVVFDKFLRKTCKLQKPCNAITETFRKISFSTVKSNYKNVSQNTDRMTNLFSKINSRIEAGEFTSHSGVQTSSVIEMLKQKNANVKEMFKSSFSEEALQTRSNKLADSFSGLSDKIFKKVYGNFKEFFFNLKSLTTFVSEEAVAGDKAEYIAALADKKKMITNNPQDNYKSLSAVLDEIKNAVNPTDKKSMETLKSLKALTKRYANLSGENEAQMRHALVAEINSALQQAEQISKTAVYTPKMSKKISSLLLEYGNIINADKKGEIEEILSLYKKILPPEEYAKAKSAAQKVSKSLNNAVYKEGYEYVDKVRDLAAGSALTDVLLGMAVPVISTGAALSAADTKEKKQSVMLNYGLPLLVGVGTSTLCTIKLISGGKALITGAVSGLLTKIVCGHVDNHLKNKQMTETSG